MFTYKNYVKALSLDEAYELNQKKSNVIIGGMLWLKMQDRTFQTVIDLSRLGLDRIEENNDEFIIGAMVTLRQLENCTSINSYTNGAVKEALRHIVGVQFRNLATVGGSVYGRYGFSDVLTILMALNAKVKLYKTGIMDISEYAVIKPDRDIIEAIIIPKNTNCVAYRSIRNSSTDFPVLTCAVAKDTMGYKAVIGARPARAVCVRDSEGILKNGINEQTAADFGLFVKKNIKTESNYRASSKYRSQMAESLTRCVLMEQIGDMEYAD